MKIQFNNSYSELPEDFFEKVMPERFQNPKLIAFNEDLAQELGIDFEGASPEELALIFSGQKILEGSRPMALAYAAHQFGQFVPRLGDGRAHLLGETQGFDIQLKGSGQTSFSRRGDGRSGLGPVIREYIVSEAMAALGVPTTRALAAVTTGEFVTRQVFEPGGIFTRVAPGHIRVGTFQYFACREEIENLRILFDYTIERNYPELKDLRGVEQILQLLKQVALKQAKLVAKWMGLGFIHGVMNTDNFSVGGFTLDFGPCAFMDEYKADKVFSSIDRQGRYAYSNQKAIAQWNIVRLAECLIPLLIKEGVEEDQVANLLNEALAGVPEQFEHFYWIEMAKKFGLVFNFMAYDSKKELISLVSNFLEYLEEEELDFTLTFRKLSEQQYDDFPQRDKFKKFKEVWLHLSPDFELMKANNPWYIPRNHQVEQAIVEAREGDYTKFFEMIEVLKRPFTYQEKLHQYATAPLKSERVTETFCGT